jgi:hypothetical protein
VKEAYRRRKIGALAGQPMPETLTPRAAGVMVYA